MSQYDQKRLNRNRQLKCRYGITEKEYDEMLIGQGNSCAICNAQSAYLNGKGKLFVDHDHIDGVVRGLLCNKYNTIIANVEELFGNLDKLKRVLEYLKIKADKFPG